MFLKSVPFWIFTGFGVTGTATPVSYVVSTSPFFKTMWQRSVSLTKPVFKCTGGGETSGQDNNTYAFYLYVSDEEGSGADKKEKILLKVVNEKTGKTLSKSKTKFTVESTASQDTGVSSSVLIIPIANNGHLVKMIKCSDFLWTSTSGTGSMESKAWIETSKDGDFFTKQEESCKRKLGFSECTITIKPDSQLKWNENIAPKVIYSAF